MFQQSCFIKKNTPELHNKLKRLGYDEENLLDNQYEGLLTHYRNPGEYWCFIPFTENNITSNKILSKTVINCGENEELFLAIAALKDNSDKDQWFVCDYSPDEKRYKKGDWYLSYEQVFLNGNYHKATLEELYNKFNNKSVDMNIDDEIKELEEKLRVTEELENRLNKLKELKKNSFKNKNKYQSWVGKGIKHSKNVFNLITKIVDVNPTIDGDIISYYYIGISYNETNNNYLITSKNYSTNYTKDIEKNIITKEEFSEKLESCFNLIKNHVDKF